MSSAKLKLSQVKEIKRLLAEGVPVGVLANKYGVHKQTISDIKNGVTWKKVT